MSDSKTAKKIDVVPCPTSLGKCFHVEIDGKRADGEIGWCGTEAEAQAKKEELELAAACKEIAEVSQAKRAAQPAETRPPTEQKAFEEGYADGYADCQAIRSPRAAAPVDAKTTSETSE